jgi:proton-coupled amino acid transporter
MDSIEQPVVSRATLTTETTALMHIMKSSIGTGILAMPSAFKNSGLVIGIFGVPLIGIITIHCMHLLVRCEEELCRRLEQPYLEFERVARSAFSVGPVSLRRHADRAATAVYMFLCFTQIGYCSCYALFAAESFSEITKDFFHCNITTQQFLFMLLPIMLLANMIKSLPNLSYFSSVANILQLGGLCYIFTNLVIDLPPSKSVTAFANWRTLPLFFGTAIYAFEGIGTVLPIKKGMENPSQFGGLVGVLNTAMTIVACLYIGMGFFGFLKYGDQVKGNIAFNLPEGAVNTSVKLLFAIAIFMSYPLQMFVPISMIWPKIVTKFQLERGSEKYELIQCGFRILMVTVTFIAAAVVPKLDLFISLVGAFCSSCLAWIFPPLFHTLTFWDSQQETSRLCFVSYVAKNSFIAVFGMIGFATGTYCSLRDVIHQFTM